MYCKKIGDFLGDLFTTDQRVYDSTYYDVFLSHTSADKEAVEILARRLREVAGLRPFLDKWHLIPGNPWQEELEQALDISNSCVVFLGPKDIGSWANEEMRAALNERTYRNNFRVIPVLLPGSEMPEKGHLPRFLSRLTWVDFRNSLNDNEAFHRLISGIKGVPPEDFDEVEKAFTSTELNVCPYLGLQTFQEQHAEFFFGREALTQWLVERLKVNRFLAVIGPSGSGKSSVVRAGLIPALRQGAFPKSENWQILVMTPTARSLEELSAKLVQATNQNGQARRIRQLLDDLSSDERTLHTEVRVELFEHDDSSRLMIVVDQLEELFTLCRNEQEQKRFLDNLLYASTQKLASNVFDTSQAII